MNFPDAGLIREKLEEGIARVPADTVWVLREAPKANHAVSVAWATLRAHGIEPFLAPLVPHWERKGHVVACNVRTRKPSAYSDGGYDFRTGWRDAELRLTCERIIVFHDASSNITAEWAAARGPKIFVIERGKKRATKQTKGRKPVGA